MRHAVTPEADSILREFSHLVSELEADRLGQASAAARAEWEDFLRQWPSEDEVERGLVGRSIDDLVWMLAKLRRFRTLVGTGVASTRRWDDSSDDLTLTMATRRVAT
jgi:hypothetical protein